MIDLKPDSDPEAPSRADTFAAFVGEVEPRLRRALVGSVGVDRAHDAVAEALTWAWERWPAVQEYTNPAGYLYRVARSSVRVRRRRRVRFLVQPVQRIPDIEPALPDALASLPARQREVVWLVYACEWSYREVADALGIGTSAVGTHAARGLAALRDRIGVAHD